MRWEELTINWDVPGGQGQVRLYIYGHHGTGWSVVRQMTLVRKDGQRVVTHNPSHYAALPSPTRSGSLVLGARLLDLGVPLKAHQRVLKAEKKLEDQARNWPRTPLQEANLRRHLAAEVAAAEMEEMMAAPLNGPQPNPGARLCAARAALARQDTLHPNANRMAKEADYMLIHGEPLYNE